MSGMENLTFYDPKGDSNQYWVTPKGRSTNSLSTYQQWMQEDRATGANDNLVDTYSNLFDRNFQNTTRLMDQTHRFRVKEGATQGQMDAQAFKRLNAELETRKFMQSKGQELTNWQRDQDQRRAMASFKNVGR